MNMESFKISGRPNILTFIANTLYQLNDISRVTCKIASNVIFLTTNSTDKSLLSCHCYIIEANHSSDPPLL